jgi:CBS domain-containing protein
MSRRPRRRRQDSEREETRVAIRHGLNLGDYLDELAEVRAESTTSLATAGERALKTLDRYLVDLAHALGMEEQRISMGDALRFLSRLPGTPMHIAAQADIYRETRNALAHNPDLMLRPEAAPRVIDGVEGIVRMASDTVHDLARRQIVTVRPDERAVDARDRMLGHGYNQLVVVNEGGGLVDLLTERDLVAAEARVDLDGNGASLTVAEAIAERGRPAVAMMSPHGSVAEAVEALRDERVGAVVITARGRLGEKPLGILTRGDVLKLL